MQQEIGAGFGVLGHRTQERRHQFERAGWPISGFQLVAARRQLQQELAPRRLGSAHFLNECLLSEIIEIILHHSPQQIDKRPGNVNSSSRFSAA